MTNIETNSCGQISSRSHPFYTPKIDISIASATLEDSGLRVSFTNQAEHLFGFFWLRDHGIDDQSLDHDTLQRLTNTFEISKDLKLLSFELDLDKQLINLRWNDEVTTTISGFILSSVINLNPARHKLAPNKQRHLWNANSRLENNPQVDFEAVMKTDIGLLELLENIYIYGFSLISEVPATEADTTLLAKHIGIVQETIFGGMWPLSSDLSEHGDSAYSTSHLEPHTDATYSYDAPGLQMFNCLEFDGKGGESIQVDGFAIAEHIKQSQPDAYEVLSEVAVPAHYIEPGVHLHDERPMFRHNVKGELIQVSFNNYDRAPFWMPDEISERFHSAYKLFHQLAIDQNNWIKIKLRPGTTLIFDNWRNMHGRMGYTGKRVFYGCYHARSEFESKLRVMQAKVYG